MPLIERLLNHTRRTEVSAEIDREIEFHMAELVDELRAQGMSDEDARLEARRRFGNRDLQRARTRDTEFIPSLETLGQDVRWAVRSLARNPGFTAVAGVVLALAIAASTAVYGVVNAVLVRPLPYPHPEQLVSITSVFRAPNGDASDTKRVALTDVALWREQAPKTIASMGGFAYTQIPIRVGSQAFSPVTVLVDPQLLGVLGVAPARGSFYEPVSGSASNKGTVVISNRLWASAFNSDSAIVGAEVNVNGEPMRVRAVMPAEFQFPRADASYYTKPVDLIMLSEDMEGFTPSSQQFFGIARMGPNATIATGEKELASIVSRIGETNDAQRNWTVSVTSLADATRKSTRMALLIVLAVAGVLLVIAAVNVMTLQLSRGAAAIQSLTVRRAMGCSTTRLTRQLLLESACLTAASGIVGLLIAGVMSRVMVAFSPVYLPVTGQIGIDRDVVLFVIGICTVTAMVSGLLPAYYAARSSDEALRSSSFRTSTGRSVARLQRTLCVAQIALGVALLSVASALVGQMVKLGSINNGFNTERLIGFSFSIPSDRTPQQQTQFYQSALDEVRALPGVESAGLISFIPPEIRAGVFMPVAVDGQAGKKQRPSANHLITSPGYFETVGMKVIQGRGLEEHDREGTTPVVVVNEAFVRKFFPDRRGLGRSISVLFDGGATRQIVGIVADAFDRGVDKKPVPTLYIPFRQFSLGYGSMVVRTKGDPMALVPDIRRTVHKLDTAVPLVDFQRLTDREHEALAEPRFYTYLAAVCAGMALLFVMFGVFGIVSFSVTRRTSEFGIRMAIGATSSRILGMVLRQSALMAATGALIGLWLAMAFNKSLEKLPFKVETSHVATVVAGVAMVSIVVLAAGYWPARRASRVNPLTALRHE